MPGIITTSIDTAERRWHAPFVIALVAAGVTLASDQFAKWMITDVVMNPPRMIAVLPFLNLRLAFNTGVSFSLFAESLSQAVWLVVLIKVGIVFLLLWWAAGVLKRSEGLGLGLVIGGALGNIVDRLHFGAVVDFVDLYYGEWHWPTFNTADVAITAGVGILLVSGFIIRRPTSREPGRDSGSRADSARGNDPEN
jgi:signal peptidase II